MHQSPSTKYKFRIRTRNGGVVSNLVFLGRDEADAERKLRQIYFNCEILEFKRVVLSENRNGPMSYEDIVDLISAPSALPRE